MHGLPCFSLVCRITVPAPKLAAGQGSVTCTFRECGKKIGLRPMWGHVGGRSLQGHYWDGQGRRDLDAFCLFCGSCDGRCTAKFTAGELVTSCLIRYENLRVSRAKMPSHSQRCTVGPQQCPIKISGKRICSYVAGQHMDSGHASLTMHPPTFALRMRRRLYWLQSAPVGILSLLLMTLLLTSR